MKRPRGKRSDNWPWQAGGGSVAVRAADITRSEEFQIRVKGTLPGVVKKYADEMHCGQKFPPVSLAQIDGKLFLVEGWHRFEAAHINLGHENLEAVITPMKWREAKAVASRANATQGQGLTSADKRRRLSLFLQAGLHKVGGEIAMSYRDLEQELGIKRSTLHRYMELDHPVTFKAMAKDDTQSREAEPPQIDRDPENLRRTSQALRDALAACDALRDPELRQQAIDEAERVIVQMKLKEHFEADPLDLL